MDNNPSPMTWSFACGTWFRTRMRISWFLPLLFVLLCIRLHDVSLGIAVGLVFLISTLLHEFGHIFAVRATGGSGDEILLWPLGGLAAVAPGPSFRSRLLTPAAGPLVNLTLCLIVLIPVLGTEYRTAVFYPFEVPVAALGATVVPEILAITFWVNWLLLLINLIPVYPLDGGRILHACLATRWPSESVTNIYLKVGCVVGFIGFMGGMMADSIWVVAISAIVLILNLQESFQLKTGERYDDSFLGYDFSQGYTSLERDEKNSAANSPGMIQRWREKRRAEKRRLKQKRKAEIQVQLDALLEKIQTSGMDSLTDAERRQLEQASALYRDKSGPGVD